MKTVLITGGSRGIGAEMVRRFARGGYAVAFVYHRAEVAAKNLADETGAFAICEDLSTEAACVTAVARAIEALGHIDVLINNAGVAQNTAFEDISLEEFDKIMAINLRTPFILTQQVLPYLKKSGSATIINIASVVSHAGYPHQSIYTASKHALLGMTKSIASEYYKDNIRVHAIAPGGVYTDMVKVSRPDLTPDGMILPSDIADIIHFFLANRGNAVIDEIIVHRVGKEPFLV